MCEYGKPEQLFTTKIEFLKNFLYLRIGVDYKNKIRTLERHRVANVIE